MKWFRFGCFNCGYDWKRKYQHETKVGPCRRIVGRDVDAMFGDNIVIKEPGEQVQSVECPACGVVGPHEMEYAGATEGFK